MSWDLRRRLFTPVDVAALVYVRIAFGAVMLAEVIRYFAYGWIGRYYLEPTFFFTYEGFDWVRPLPAAGMYGLFAALGVLSVLITVGLFFRVAASLFAIGISYVFLLDQANYLNHLYLVCLLSFLLAVVPAHAAGSLDARRRGKSEQTAPAWTLWLLRGQIAAVFVFGAIAKIDADWLSGWPAGRFLDNWSLTAPLSHSDAGRKAFAIAGLLFDLLIIPALLWKRTRLPATAAAMAFHLTNFKLFNIGIFPWLMLALIPLFWPTQSMRRILAWLGVLPAQAPSISASPVAPPGASAITSALALYALLQLLLPLRHWLYPGQVNWTEEGHNFSWHMKLRIKTGQTVFVVVDRDKGETWEVRPRDQLTARQARKMSTRPDLLLQFARELLRQQQAAGRPNVAIYARAEVSLNGRTSQWIVDPSVDLGRRQRTPGAADWIVPLGAEWARVGALAPDDETD